MSRPIRLLFLSDTHLGLDEPLRPRVDRRRLGPDQWAAFERALEPARRGLVDCVLHGGDLFFRSRVRLDVVARGVEALAEIGARVPVVLVPGNHDRSRLPYPLLWQRPGLLALDRPGTVTVPTAGGPLAVTGWPYRRGSLAPLLAEGAPSVPAAARVLLLHQLVEGARVGPMGYCFRPSGRPVGPTGDEVVPGSGLPSSVAVVLAGHVHRAQWLDRDLSGRPLPAPVVYAGATARTSFAEAAETKGYVLLELLGSADGRGRIASRRFVPLPSRPWREVVLGAEGSRPAARRALRHALASVEPDAVVRVVSPDGLAGLSGAEVRAVAGDGRTVLLAVRPPRASPTERSDRDPRRGRVGWPRAGSR